MMLRIGSRGFTLIEVMLAVSILAIGIIGVLRAYSTAVNALGVGQENIDAVCLLKEKMSEIERLVLEGEGISPGTSSGRFEGELESFEWESVVKQSSVEDLNEVVITVSNKAKPRKFSLVTYAENKK